MPADDPNSHSASIEVAVAAETAFEYMASGMNQRRWALGSWERVDHGEGLFSGTSLWDASTRLTQARVVPGAELGRDPGACVITLTTWRGAAHTDASWARTYHAYATEMHLIKGRLEHEFPAGV